MALEKLSRATKPSAILLDTNILVDSIKFGHVYATLYAELERAGLGAALDHVVQLEFARGLPPTKAEEFLRKLFGSDRLVLPVRENLFQLALRISHVYLKTENKNCNLPDLLIAAQMALYSKDDGQKYDLLLATQNHKDFPPVFFDRIDEMILTLPDGSIKVVGFYRFNRKRAKEANLFSN